MANRQLDEEAVFHVAREIAKREARSDYLDQVCCGDQALRERVEALLDIHEQEEEFLKSSPEPAPTVDQPPISEKSGHQIGHYKLLQKIGEGGFGVVYMAEQQRPVRRKVALKIIKPGMDSRDVISRFEAERQALALMDHPNISRVLDGGTTDAGRPYFVMELVKGVPITEYCDANHLTTDERLKLFITVCQAVQHAHQKGIIHRDLKPSNILITLHDGEPVAKVIDFGVAKAINQQLTERTLFTAYGQMVGTPQYMSPEQAEISGLDVDTRSDVYSLGVLLYELLTGTTPIDGGRLRTAGYAEMQRIIRDEEPPKPSTRLSTTGERLTTIAKHRGLSPERLHKSIRGDLDWIVMKALDKDRVRRYETAAALVLDVRRHLDDEPIEARPPSGSYRVLRFIRRNRGPVIAATAVFLTLMTGLVMAAIGWRQTEAALGKLRESLEKRAELEKENVDLVMDEILVAALSGDTNEARRRLAKSKSLRIPDGWHEMVEGQIYLIEGRYNEAFAKLKEAEDSLGKRAAIVAMSSLALQGMGSEERIWRGFTELQDLERRDFADYLFGGWALSEFSAEEAMDDLEKARQLWPASHVVMMVYARALRNLSEIIPNPREALEKSEHVLDLLKSTEAYLGKRPGTQSAMVVAHLIAYGRCSEIGCAERGKRHLEAAKRIAETLDVSSADALLARANLFRQTGNTEQILKDFESVKGRVHEHATFSNLCATLFYRNGQYEKALEIYDEFDRARADTGVYAFRLFARLGEVSKEDLQRQCRDLFENRLRDPENVQRYHDWIICQLLGETELARKAAEGFIQGAKALNKDMWLTVGKFMKGEIGEDQLIDAFNGRRFEVAHGHFLIAMDRLSRGDRTGARQSFQKVIDTNVPRYYVSWWSEAFEERLKHDPNWIPWLPNSSEPEGQD